MQHRIRATVAWTVAALALLVAVSALAPTVAAAGEAAPGLSPRVLADASWHGRPIQRPVVRPEPIADRSAELVRGTGYHAAGGSRRVRDLQRRLTRLGYRPGRSDGLYGPRTQAAVLAFQRKHGLERDGAAGSETLALVRRRTSPRPAPARQAPATQPAPERRTASETRDDDAPTWLALAGAAVLLALAAVSLRRTRPTPANETPQPLVREVLADPIRNGEEPRIHRVPGAFHGPPWQRRAALRQRILAMKADGMTLQEIADRLTEEGEPTLGGHRRWQPWNVQAATRAAPPGRRPAGRDAR